jgi:beta-alanine degradation protein BauB
MANFAKSIVHITNDRVIVTEWRFDPGANTGWHRHDHDYVIVPIKDGKLRLLESGDVIRDVPLKQGVPYFRKAGGSTMSSTRTTADSSSSRSRSDR